MKAPLLATIARDPELKISSKGTPFMYVSVWEYTGDKTQDGKKETQFFDLTVFGKQAEGLHPYMTKGKQFLFYVDKVKPKTFEQKDGSLSVSLKAVVTAVDFVNSKEEAQQPRQETTKAEELVDDIPF